MMAHRALMGLSKALPKRTKEQYKPFKNLLLLDFEATCEKDEIIKPQEIIELPCLVVSSEDWEVKDVFHEYVKPRVKPQISTFCTELTGILQENLDKQKHFPEVFANFCQWLEEGKYFDEKDKSAFVTCGDWDLKVMLPNQCKLDGIEAPSYFDDWINLKSSFYEATKYYPRSLLDMLKHLKMAFKGRQHCGLDDAHNMYRIINTLAHRYEAQFTITTNVKEIKTIN